MPGSWQFLLLLYLCAVSLVSAAATVWDKHRAKAHKWRVPEATLLLLAALGGSAAMYLTMRAVRHKTRRRKFMVGIPVIFVLQLALAAGVAWGAHGLAGLLSAAAVGG
ncbi:MAG TPA: DUF1294 domain-containing protein [Firmicutes bacterium]|nr:DUF1294 domain-containing protein [Bacillota bacterium]